MSLLKVRRNVMSLCLLWGHMKCVLPGLTFLLFNIHSWKNVFTYYWNCVWSYFHRYNSCHSDMHSVEGTVSHTFTIHSVIALLVLSRILKNHFVLQESDVKITLNKKITYQSLTTEDEKLGSCKLMVLLSSLCICNDHYLCIYIMYSYSLISLEVHHVLY